MSRANPRDTNLSSVKVEKALFGYNSAVSEKMKLDLIERGAIFEGSTGVIVGVGDGPEKEEGD